MFSANASDASKQHAYPDSQKSTLRQSSYTLREGYTFTGYNTEQDGSGKTITNDTVFDFIDATDGKPTVTVYPQFTANEFTITYMTNTKNDNGGDTKDGVSYYDIEGAVFDFTRATISMAATFAGKLPTLTTAPAGYTFDGWYTRNGAMGGLMDSTNNSDWGTKVTDITVYDLKLDTIKSGYKWEDHTSKTDANLINVTRDITLFARWKRNEYTLTWDGNQLNGSDNVGSTDVTLSGNRFTKAWYGLPIGKDNKGVTRDLPSASRFGYNFKGWNLVGDGRKVATVCNADTPFKPANPGDTAATILAIWDPLTYTVVLNSNSDKYKAPAIDSGYLKSNLVNPKTNKSRR